MFTWFKRKPKPTPTWVMDVPAGTSQSEYNELLVQKLDVNGTAERMVTNILRWCHEAKAKNEMHLKVLNYDFDRYGAELTPLQDQIIRRLKELKLQPELKSVKRATRSGTYCARHLEVSW